MSSAMSVGNPVINSTCRSHCDHGAQRQHGGKAGSGAAGWGGQSAPSAARCGGAPADGLERQAIMFTARGAGPHERRPSPKMKK